MVHSNFDKLEHAPEHRTDDAFPESLFANAALLGGLVLLIVVALVCGLFWHHAVTR